MGHYGQSDEALAEACKNGDDEAFRELMVRHAGPVTRFVSQYVRTDEDAEDAAQDAFFKAWKHIKRFQTGKTWKPWLYAIARNTALDLVKKKRAVNFSSLDDEDNDLAFADSLADEEPLQNELFERTELAAELERAMDILHPDHRAVILMHYRENMTFDEIAEAVDRPMNTVKSWHQRALLKLRPRLSGRDREP